MHLNKAALRNHIVLAMTGIYLWSSTAAMAVSPQVTMKTTLAQAGASFTAEDILGTPESLRHEINEKLKDADFVQSLQNMGIQPKEVQMRLMAMSDQELWQISQNVQRQAGGEVIVISLTAALIIILVIVLLVR